MSLAAYTRAANGQRSSYHAAYGLFCRSDACFESTVLPDPSLMAGLSTASHLSLRYMCRRLDAWRSAQRTRVTMKASSRWHCSIQSNQEFEYHHLHRQDLSSSHTQTVSSLPSHELAATSDMCAEFPCSMQVPIRLCRSLSNTSDHLQCSFFPIPLVTYLHGR